MASATALGQLSDKEHKSRGMLIVAHAKLQVEAERSYLLASHRHQMLMSVSHTRCALWWPAWAFLTTHRIVTASSYQSAC